MEEEGRINSSPPLMGECTSGAVKLSQCQQEGRKRRLNAKPEEEGSVVVVGIVG